MSNPRLLIIVCLVAFANVATAEDRNWKDPVSGSFHLGSNWLEGSPPGAADRAIFDKSSAGYSVSFSSNVNNEALEVRNDIVTLELGVATYELSSFVRVGEGSNGQLTLHGNALEVIDFTGVGDNGVGLLRIEGGADWVTHNGLTIGSGNPTTSDGTVIVNGAGSSLELLNCCGVRIGQGAGNTGNLTIENNAIGAFGPGTHFVGLDGEGTLTIQTGGQLTLTASDLHVGDGSPGASGHVLVTGPSSELAISNVLRVGVRGIADLTVDSGAYVSANFIDLGNLATGDGQITIRNPGTILEVFDAMNIGFEGQSTVLVEDGATVLAGDPGLFGGIGVWSAGFLGISNATYQGNGLSVGVLGGQAEISAGGIADVRGFSVGAGLGNFGEVTVTGAGSTLSAPDYFAVGEYGGTGTLNILDGAVVSSGGEGNIGWDPLSTGFVTVSGLGSEWNGQGALVGRGGDGHLVVNNGGKVIFSNNMLIGADESGIFSSGLVTGAGSAVELGTFFSLGNGADVSFVIANGASVAASEMYIARGVPTIAALVQVDGLGSTLDVTNFIDIGSGAGTLSVENGGIVNAGWITLFSNGTVRGNGELAVASEVGNSGRIEPGLSSGVLTINGNFLQGSMGTMATEIGGLSLGTQHDQLVVTGTANLAGQLELDLINGFVPSAGDSFDIMTYGSVSGRFQTIISDNLPTGLQWALDYNPTVLTLIACDPIADPSCDDCNLNGILDGEDIANLTSLDVDLDGIPDECANFVAACFPPTDQWSCFDNWDLPGSQYPDDVASAAGVFVTLNDTDNVTLDVDATIPGLRIVDEAELHASGGDLTVYGSSDTLVEGHLFAGDRDIDLSSNRLVLAPGGVYEKDASEADALGTLTAGSAYLFGNACTDPPCPHGGEMTLEDDIEVAVIGSLTLDGRLADGPCDAVAATAALSFHTPPSIRVLLDSRINVGLNFLMQGAAGFVHQSTQPITIGDDWDNQGTQADCFDCRLGTVILTGANHHLFEVAGTDDGPVGVVDGTEFVMGGLEVMDNAQVVFRDAFDNNGTGPATCGEALYVDVLTLGAGSTVILENCRVYYQTLVKDPSATVITNGCAELMSVTPPEAPGSDPSGLNKARSISIEMPNTVNAAGGSESQAIKITLVSLHRVVPPYTGGPSIPFDSFEGQVRWAGPPEQYVESSSSPIPFFVSTLQCAPHYQDWSTIGLLHILGTAVVPSSSYEVRIAADSCQGIENRCTALSAPLTVVTTRWGDVETPFNPPSSTIQPDIGDIGALVNKFRSAPGAPIKARALLAGAPGNPFGEITPEVLNVDFGFSHISACVDAFRGVPYPYTIAQCP